MTEQDIENWYNSGRMPYRFDMTEFEEMIENIRYEAWKEGSLARADKGLGLADNPYGGKND